ncbi:MAG: hypothetical protein P8X39_10970, partial [Desulfofustis sp.]
MAKPLLGLLANLEKQYKEQPNPGLYNNSSRIGLYKNGQSTCFKPGTSMCCKHKEEKLSITQ